MLNHHELLEMDLDKNLFLIDGNNIFPTSKHFKKYFLSYNVEQKIEAQIRLRWLVSMALKGDQVVLFFDEKYDDDSVKAVLTIVAPNVEEQARIESIPVIYGNEVKADERIVDHCQDIASNKSN